MFIASVLLTLVAYHNLHLSKDAWIRSALNSSHNFSITKAQSLQKWLAVMMSGASMYHVVAYTLCLKKNGPTLKRYSSKLHWSILMIFGRNIQKALE